MNRMLLMSLVIMTFVLPIRSARNPNAMLGLRRAIFGMTAWVGIYVVILAVFRLLY